MIIYINLIFLDHEKKPFDIDYETLYDFAEKNNNKYLQAKPFPHIIIDNFLSPIAYSRISKAFPKKMPQFGRPRLTNIPLENQ